MPSDMQGYFISEYTVAKNGTVAFKDNNSLLMSIVSDINDFYNIQGLMIEKIDEINFEE